MDKNLTDNEIVKALENEANEKVCIHEVYEPACGVWCKHLHLWCTDFNGNSNKNNCSAFKPTATNKRTKEILDLINRLQAENETKDTIIANQGKIIEELLTNMGKVATEAYKEFAKRLNNKGVFPNEINDDYAVGLKTIDKLLKELGENDAR